jgi:hypothetical protein
LIDGKGGRGDSIMKKEIIEKINQSCEKLGNKQGIAT